MKSHRVCIFLLCAALFICACGQEERLALDEETVMSSFLQELFSADFEYDDIEAYATESLIETLQANRYPFSYQKYVWNYSDTISCNAISFEATSENHFEVALTLTWENEDGEQKEQDVRGTMGVTFDEESKCLVNYLYLKL